MGPNAGRQGSHIEQTAIDANAKRRIHKGTKAGDMAAGPPLVPLQEVRLLNKYGQRGLPVKNTIADRSDVNNKNSSTQPFNSKNI